MAGWTRIRRVRRHGLWGLDLAQYFTVPSRMSCPGYGPTLLVLVCELLPAVCGSAFECSSSRSELVP